MPPIFPLGPTRYPAIGSRVVQQKSEPAIVFPFYPFGVNIEAAHLPGSVFLQQDVIFALLENICDEMARNGLTKIILHNGHGGNRYFLPLFTQMLPGKQKPYVVYQANLPYNPKMRICWKVESMDTLVRGKQA